jgi:signal transduction histidine kinase
MEERATPRWLDVLWLIFLGGLALLPPVREWHKQLILLAVGVFQLLEGRLVRFAGKWGRVCAVSAKIILATVLLYHTHEVPISSSYWPIFWLPVLTAATYFSPVGTLFWTGVASAAYCANLIPVTLSQAYDINWENGWSVIVLRILFFFLVAMTVNGFVMGYRQQVQRFQELSENLSEANRNLKQAQAEARRAERLAALGQLSAGLAHEIRNPLGVIKGSAEILNQKLGASEPLAQELAGYIYTEVNRLGALVSRFLEFARPERLDLHAEDLPMVMEKSIRAVEQQGASARVQVHRDYAPGMPQVRIDSELCEHAFTNLLLNACEAMGEAGGELKINIHPEHEGSQVTVDIEDSGPGVPMEMKEQIFNPFVTTKKTGVGLGLAIVSKIVDAHGGTVNLTSKTGQGACFRITLPAA